MEHNPYANTKPEQVASAWEKYHEGLAVGWDPERADGMTWEEFDERSKTMSISAYLNYDIRQAPMFSDRDDQIIANAFGEDFAQDLRDIHEGRFDAPSSPKKQNRIRKFLGKISTRG